MAQYKIIGESGDIEVVEATGVMNAIQDFAERHKEGVQRWELVPDESE